MSPTWGGNLFLHARTCKSIFGIKIHTILLNVWNNTLYGESLIQGNCFDGLEFHISFLCFDIFLLLNNILAKDEPQKKLKKIHSSEQKWNTIYQNFWNRDKVVLTGKFTELLPINQELLYLKKESMYQINNVSAYLEKEEQKKPKSSEERE